MYIAGWDGAIPVMQKIVSGSVIRATGALDLVGIGARVDRRRRRTRSRARSPTRINYPYVLVSQTGPGQATGRSCIAKYGPHRRERERLRQRTRGARGGGRGASRPAAARWRLAGRAWPPTRAAACWSR